MSAIKTSLAIPTRPWETAKGRFLENLSPNEVRVYETATLENLFYDASNNQKSHGRGSRIWRLQERLSPLIDSVEDYGKAMDVFVNTCPLVMSPLWGSIRVILLVRQTPADRRGVADNVPGSCRSCKFPGEARRLFSSDRRRSTSVSHLRSSFQGP
jgi:hypothetical protein